MRNDFFSLAPVGCFVLDASGQVLDVNERGAHQLGYAPPDLLQRPFSMLVAAEEEARLRAYLEAVLAGGGPRGIELALQHRQGHRLAGRLESQGDTPAGADGGYIRTVLIDVSDAARRRSALTAFSAKLGEAGLDYEAVLHVVCEQVVRYAGDGCVIRLQGAGPRSAPAVVISHPEPDVASRLQARFADAGGGPVSPEAPDEEPVPYRLFDVPMRFRGETIGTLGVVRAASGPPVCDEDRWLMQELADRAALALSHARLHETIRREVQERKRTEAELVRARDRAEEMARLKSTFLANMSHEIRTPLTGIIGFAAVLSKELPDEQQEFAELIESSGRRLLDMLNSVLDLAKLEANQIELKLDEIDVSEEAERTVRLLRPMALQKGLVLVFEAAPGAEHVRARLDRPAFNRILHNLISNAIKFTEEGRVTVRAEADAGRIYLHVSDTGIGVDPSFRPFLFDEFRQESTGVTRSHEGSGLGLAITKRLVELMRGEIHVESEKGRGSTFTVAFPQISAPVPARPPAEREAESPERHVQSNARILLVEDQAEAQHLLLELLDELYDVSVASSADEALRLVRRTKFDMIIVDINLGTGPDGTDVLRELRAMHAYRKTPIVALTAYALPGDRERFLEMGFTAYLSKPFDVDELLRLPARLL